MFWLEFRIGVYIRICVNVKYKVRVLIQIRVRTRGLVLDVWSWAIFS